MESLLALAGFLFFLGVVFLCLDVNIEGFGAMAAAGLTLVITAAVAAIAAAPVFGVYIVLAMVIILALSLYITWRIVQKTKLREKLILEETLEEDDDDKAGLPTFIGKMGVSKTSLRPCGFVTFGSEDVEAYSDGPYILENTPVVAVRVAGRKLYVKTKGV